MGIEQYKIDSFKKPVSALADTPQMSADELKAWFDSNTTDELKTSVNGIVDAVLDMEADAAGVAEALDGKVDKELGKGLSENDYTDEEKQKVESTVASLTALEHNTTLIQNSGGGFAGGKAAKAVDSSGGGIDAIQLGTGTNSTPKTVQAYGYQLMDANGKIPDARLNDAPGDGTLYGRKDGGWEELTSLHTHANKAVLDATEVAYTENEQARIGTLESDLDTFYTDLNDLQNTAVTDAPSDGNTYARKDGAWSAISTGGGMATLSWDEMDDFEKGIATVTRSYTTTDTGSGTHYSDVCLLIAGSFYITYNGAHDGPAQRRQALIYPDGKIMTRITDYNSGQWNEWKEYVPSAS